jgi:hypothetical protein
MNWTMSRSDRFRWTTYEAQAGRLRLCVRQVLDGYILLVQQTERGAPWWEEERFPYLKEAQGRAETVTHAELVDYRGAHVELLEAIGKRDPSKRTEETLETARAQLAELEASSH